jgi:beta-phosphoglucomutase-like phosphatase (HAD superfamily)
VVPRAVIFDLNGTLSDDEQLLCEIFAELFAEHGRPLRREEYFDKLAGLPDPEIVSTWLGPDHPAVGKVIEERVGRYLAAAGDGSSVPRGVREAVRYAAERVPVGVVSGATRAEVEQVVEGAGLRDVIRTVVASEDVVNGKPDPEGYRRALVLLDGGRLAPAEVVVFEDTEAGVASAKAAGMRCLAVTGTLPPARLAEADEIVPAIDVPLMRRLLG